MDLEMADDWPSQPGDFKNQHLQPRQQVSKNHIIDGPPCIIKINTVFTIPVLPKYSRLSMLSTSFRMGWHTSDMVSVVLTLIIFNLAAEVKGYLTFLYFLALVGRWKISPFHINNLVPIVSYRF